MSFSLTGCFGRETPDRSPQAEGRHTTTPHRGVDPLLAATSTVDFSWVGRPALSVVQAGERLESETDPDTLGALLTWLALKTDQDAHALLRSALTRADLRRSLDPAEEAPATYLDLRLSWIVAALASSLAEAPRASLDALSELEFVQQEVFPQQLVARAFAAQRPPSDRALAFWRRYAGPNALITGDVLLAAAVNGTAPALELWSNIWRDPGHAPELRIAWMRQIIFPLRHREEILLAVEALLPLLESRDLQEAMAEVILADEDRWSLPGTEVVGPPEAMSAAARAVRRRIARWAAENLGLS